MLKAGDNKPKNEADRQDDRMITDLVRKSQGGSPESRSEHFGRLYDVYFDRIYSYIYYRVHHKEAAEDLAEEVFVKAWTKIGSVNADSFGGWLYSIAKNKIIDHYRKQRETVDLSEIENLIESATNIADETNLKINQKLLLEMIRKLAPEQQIIIKLKFIEGLENQEISELISKSEGSIRVVQHRAMQKLTEMIKQKESENKSNFINIKDKVNKPINPLQSDAKE